MEKELNHLMEMNAAVKEETCEGSGVTPNEPAALYTVTSLKPGQDVKPMKMMPGSDILEAMHKHEEDSAKNFGDATTKQQFSCANPFATSHLAGSTTPWINSILPTGPSQLTIFYGGIVRVFDHIAPEKAQAIIFMAGNECIPSNMAGSKLSAADWLMANQSMPPVVPQARRASLARFLEKRKERAKNAAPYARAPRTSSCAFSATSADSSNSAGSTSMDSN